MADIELVIKIDENTYHRIISGFANEDDAVLFEDLFKNGVTLPKGHGALKDVQDLKRLSTQYEVGVSAFSNEPIIATSYHSDGDGVWESLYDNAPTIVEADKAESDGT